MYSFAVLQSKKRLSQPTSNIAVNYISNWNSVFSDDIKKWPRLGNEKFLKTLSKRLIFANEYESLQYLKNNIDVYVYIKKVAAIISYLLKFSNLTMNIISPMVYSEFIK